MKQAIIIFTRVPAAGRTKTRLMPFLSEEECAGLHKEFIRDIYESCKKAEADIIICYTPEPQKEILCTFLKDDTPFVPQIDGDLGKRMECAFKDAFDRGYERAVLIGTDIPQITPEILNDAFKTLDSCDIVINPTKDGGYYLIGMKENHESVWNIKRYGTNTVIKDTLDQLKNVKLIVSVGTMCRDIDTKEDLRELYVELEKQKIKGPKYTWTYLNEKLGSKLQPGFGEGVHEDE